MRVFCLLLFASRPAFGYGAPHHMQDRIETFLNWLRGFRFAPLSRTARRDIGFWAIAASALFFLFHLHGNSQEIAAARHSLFRWLATRWTGDYAYCAFLPLASMAALWMRRREISAARRQTDWRGAPIFVSGLVLHWIGVLAQQPRISSAGLVVILWALPFFLYGWDLARWLLFPCGYLFLAIPLNFIDSMTAPLRLFATAVSAVLLNGFGLQVQRVGAGLFSSAGNAFAFNVAPECSGLRSLLAMTALMGFYAWFSQKSLSKKWILFLLSLPVAVAANVARVILVVVVAAFWGQETAMGLWHDYSGYPIFLIGISLMLVADRLLNMDYRAAWNQISNRFFSPASS